MKKVLLISYYWPPSGGAGVQRCLKFVKYFRDFGWEPIVFTADEAEYPIYDNSLQKDIPEGISVIRKKIWEPYNLYKKITGRKKDEKVYSGFLSEQKKNSTAQNLSVFIRGNLFIPDARMFWIRPSISFLNEYLKTNKVDAILSSGPPHTTHRIALGVKKKINIPWIADFRDPWTQIDFYEQLKLTRFADIRHKRMENEVLRNASKVVTVSWHWADDLKRISGREIEVIPNGYDTDDFRFENAEPDNSFSFYHIGSLNGDRNPHVFWTVIKNLADANADFRNDLKIHLIGKNDFSVFESIKKNELEQFVQVTDYMPHAEVVQQLGKARLLFLPLNDTPNQLGIIPGKLFEYLAARKIIFAIGPEEGDTGRIIKETNGGVICNFNDEEKMKSEILRLYDEFKNGNLISRSHDIEKYSRRNATRQMAELLNSIIK